MIRLKELIELKGMKYYMSEDEVKKKHQKRMKMETPNFHENIILPKSQPPDNDSITTRNELKYLSDIEENDSFAESMDDIVEVFKPHSENLGLHEYVKSIVKESAKFIMLLKYHYNRPRPHQVASFLEMDLNGSTMLESMKTPSYPSGHAVQGYLIADILSHRDPRNAPVYQQLGEDIAHSRIVAKAHYPSDKKFGKKVSRVLFKGLKGFK
jgi:hypothetical protein